MNSFERPPLLDPLQLAHAAMRRGENVASALRARFGDRLSSQRVIELAYEMQAGSYVEEAKGNWEFRKRQARCLADHLRPHVQSGTSFLDCGSGELTNLALVVLELGLEEVLAFDISFSRLSVGKEFAREILGDRADQITLFSAEMERIPLPSGAVDVVSTVHALEPNGGREAELISELLRVARQKLVLFEPSYEHSSPEGRERMDRHNYVRDLAGAAEQAGGRVESVTMLEVTSNPLNPTACYLISKVGGDVAVRRDEQQRQTRLFSDPGTDHPLERVSGGYYSAQRGVIYPEIMGVPIVREQSAIIAAGVKPRRSA